MEFLTIDGSRGEGGGQVLRTSLALSLVLGAPLRIVKIRAGRARPGLMRQHLTAVRAAAAISNAAVEGAEVGSRELTFRPGPVTPGEYRFAVGTAGSVTLVFQTVLPALALASGPSTCVFEGGTHNPMAPTFDFLERAFLPLFRRMGPRVAVRLERAGFYPAGGGRFTATIEPVRALAPLDLLERGAIRARRATAIVCGLPRGIAVREFAALREKLGWDDAEGRPLVLDDAWGPGNALLAEIESEHVTEVFQAIGEKGVPAEEVAAACAGEAKDYLASGAPVGPHLADQLVLPLALARGGRFRTGAPTRHLTTVLDLVRELLSVEARATRIADRVYEISISGR